MYAFVGTLYRRLPLEEVLEVVEALLRSDRLGRQLPSCPVLQVALAEVRLTEREAGVSLTFVGSETY